MHPANDNPSEPERRSAPRRRVILKGKIASLSAALTYDCVIRNLSPLGSHIRILSPEPIPLDIFLINIRDAVAFEGKVVWRRADKAGVVFRRTHDLNDGAPGPVSHLRHLRNELAPRSWRSGN